MFSNQLLKHQSFRKASQRFTKVSKNFKPFWHNHQLKIVSAIGLFFVATLTASQFTKAQPETPEVVIETREVDVLDLSQNQLNQSATGVVKNLNSITLVAQSAGPVAYVNMREGAYVKPGQLILSQESSYSGGNTAVVQRQIAAKNLELAQASLDNTVEVVSTNRELADKNRDNTEELRRITDQSIGETENLLDLLNRQIEDLNQEIANETDEDTILALEAQLIPLKAQANQIQQSLRNLHYSVNTDKPQTQLANLNRELVYETTELQLKSAEINRDIAALSLQSAKIAESQTRVVAPFAGTIEKIYVEPGTYVTPGTNVAKITGEPQLCLVTTVSGSLARQIDQTGNLSFDLNGNNYTVAISHVTSTPVSGNLYEVLATLPDWMASLIYENQAIEISLPLALNQSTPETNFIPVDAVFVSNTSRFVYVLDQGRAVKRIVETGRIVGSSIEIESGLTTDDTVILDRSINENDQVAVRSDNQSSNQPVN